MPEKISPAILFVGDSFLIEEKIKELTMNLAKEIQGEIPRQLFYLSDQPLENVLLQARTLPFLAAKQIFYIRDLPKLKKKDMESLAAYLDHPFAATYLFFEGVGLGKTDELVKLFESKAQCFFLQNADRSALEQFVRNKMKSAGKTIDPLAVRELVAEAGDMPLFLDSMVERLINYSGTNNQINEDMVQTFEEKWTQGDVFKITNALAERNTALAYGLLQEAVSDSDKDLTGLIGILHWQVRRLWLASVMLERGLGQNDVLKKCRVSPYQASLFMRQVRGFTRERLESALEGLFQLDWKMKTGRLEGASALEAWLVEMTS